MADNKNTGLATREQVYAMVAKAGAIETVEKLQAQLDAFRAVANVLAPSIAGPPPPKRAFVLAAVGIDTTMNDFGSGGEVYRDTRFCEKDECALGKVAILKILGAAGISPISSRQVDADPKRPYVVQWQVQLLGMDLTGQPLPSIGTVEIDFSDGSDELMKPEKVKREGDKWAQKTGRLVPMDDTAIADLRRRQKPLAESKALLRAARGYPGLGLRQKYKVADVQRPWIMPRLVPHLDMNDPADAAAARQAALGSVHALFGGRAEAPQLPPPVVIDHDEPEDGDGVIEGEIVTGGPADAAKDAGKASAARVVGPTPATPITTDPDADGDSREDDFAPLEEPDAPALVLCLCPCGCQAEITPEVAEKTLQLMGAPRCRRCYPGQGFDFKAHADIRDLKLPKAPGLTLEQIRRSNEKAAEKAKAKK